MSYKISLHRLAVDGTVKWVLNAISKTDGQTIGHMELTEWEKTGGWIMFVWVGDFYRRQGIARAMLQESFTLASSAKKRGLGLAVHRDNAAARALYESLGFVACYEMDGNIVMTKHLTPAP